jgi:hypothetical protein
VANRPARIGSHVDLDEAVASPQSPYEAGLVSGPELLLATAASRKVLAAPQGLGWSGLWMWSLDRERLGHPCRIHLDAQLREGRADGFNELVEEPP